MRSLDLAFDEKPFKTSQIVHNFTFKFFCHSTQLKRPFMTQASKQIMHRHRKNGLKMAKSGLLITELYLRLITVCVTLNDVKKRKSAEVRKKLFHKNRHTCSAVKFCSIGQHNLTIAIMLT